MFQVFNPIFTFSPKMMMNSCVFSAKLSDLADDSLLPEYFSMITAETAIESTTQSSKTTSSCNIPVDSANTGRFATESLTICGFAMGKSSGLLSWVVKAVWGRIVSSQAIFEIWRMIFSLFSAFLQDIIVLSKVIIPKISSPVQSSSVDNASSGVCKNVPRSTT